MRLPIALLLLSLAGAACAGDVSLSLALVPPEVAPGDAARVEMQLSWPGAQEAYSIESWTGPEVGGAPLTAISDNSATAQEAGKPTFRRQVSYAIHADQPGTIAISPTHVTLKDAHGARHEYRTEALGLTVRAGRGPVPVEALLGLAAVGLLLVVVRLSRRAPPPPPPKSRADRAVELVEGLRAVGHRDHRQFFEACVDTLREGLADMAPAAARDRGKIAQALKDAGVDQERITAAEQLMALCDEARFNPEAPGAQERERALGLLKSALS